MRVLELIVYVLYAAHSPKIFLFNLKREREGKGLEHFHITVVAYVSGLSVFLPIGYWILVGFFKKDSLSPHPPLYLFHCSSKIVLLPNH